MLLALLHCVKCQERDLELSYNVRGTLLLVTGKCQSCSYITKWSSQEYIGEIPKGNTRLSAAILLSGSLVSKALRLLEHMKVAAITSRTFFRHQCDLLFPAISKVWLERQQWLIAGLQADQRDLVIGGDGRSDTPGHSAKYGSYTVMELKSNVIVDMQLIQVCTKPHYYLNFINLI
jgi:solute carrier family 8 (sodium/calcium exchanger)